LKANEGVVPRRRLRLWLLVAVGLAVVAVMYLLPPLFLWWNTDPEPGANITRANFRRIKPGMTLAEVSAILGPPGDHTTMETESDKSDPTQWDDNFVADDVQIARTLIWSTDSASVAVGFDQSDKVSAGIYFAERPSTESIFIQLRKRFQRFWNRRFS
jgi:hypothetical protein